MQGTIKKLFENEFNLNLDEMEIGVPVDVHEANIGIKAFDESQNKEVMAKVLYAIKKEKQSSYEIKLVDRKEAEMPMAGDHFIAIYTHANGKVDYTYVKDLEVGMKLVTTTGLSEIESITKLEDDFVYDITTETGNYYTNNILSHNTAMSRAIATTGGYALRYAASTANRVKKIENLTEGNKIVGIHMNVRNYKNKTGVPWRECEMDLFFDHGFDSNCEYVDFLKEFAEDARLNNLVLAGNGGTFKSEKFGWSYRGKDNFLEVIKTGQLEGWDEIKKAVDEIISNPIEGKENTIDPESEGVEPIDESQITETVDEQPEENE